MRNQIFTQVLVAVAAAAAVLAVPGIITKVKPAEKQVTTRAAAICTFQWYLSNSRSSGTATIPAFAYGNTPMIPLAGNWDGIPGDSPGATRRNASSS
jgi:hypothetical protein